MEDSGLLMARRFLGKIVFANKGVKWLLQEWARNIKTVDGALESIELVPCSA